MENPMNKWMIWGETRQFLETPVSFQLLHSLKLTASRFDPEKWMVWKIGLNSADFQGAYWNLLLFVVLGGQP